MLGPVTLPGTLASPVPHHLSAQAKWALELLPDSAMARVDCGHDHDKGTGSGPATPQTIVNYLKVNIGGIDYLACADAVELALPLVTPWRIKFHATNKQSPSHVNVAVNLKSIGSVENDVPRPKFYRPCLFTIRCECLNHIGI